VGSTIWYNGIPTIQAKTRLALEKNLVGVMIWSLDLDVPGPESLLRAIDGEIKKTQD
jgi:chitinase